MSKLEDASEEFRVKFVDVRIGSTRQGRARAQPFERICDQAGCEAPASCKSPRGHHKLNNSVFCYRHAAEHNRAHNFFETMTQSEFNAFMEAERTGHKKTWRFGQGPVGQAARATQYWRGRDPVRHDSSSYARPSARRSRLQIKCLDALGLEANASAGQIRARYASLIKAYHPDSNDGNRSTEPELGRVIKAFKTLKSAGLT